MIFEPMDEDEQGLDPTEDVHMCEECGQMFLWDDVGGRYCEDCLQSLEREET